MESDSDLLFKFYRASIGLTHMIDTRLQRQFGIPYVQAVFLIELGRMTGAQPKELAGKIGTTSQSTTSVLDRLEKQGLVERIRDLEDRRGVRLELTPKAHGLIEPLELAIEGEARAAVCDLGELKPTFELILNKLSAVSDRAARRR